MAPPLPSPLFPYTTLFRSRDLGWRIALALDLDRGEAVRPFDHLVGYPLRLFHHLTRPPAHEALDREDGVLGVGYGLTLCHLPDEPLAILRERDHGRGDAPAFGVGDDDGIATLHDRHYRIGSAKVDPDDFLSHDECSLSWG